MSNKRRKEILLIKLNLRNFRHSASWVRFFALSLLSSLIAACQTQPAPPTVVTVEVTRVVVVTATAQPVTPATATATRPAPTSTVPAPTPVASLTATRLASTPTSSPRLPTASPTLRATDTPRPTPRPATPPATLAAALGCAMPVGPVFADLWSEERLDRTLGCPTSGELRPVTSYQRFDNGFMFWRSDTRRVYVVSGDGVWDEFPDTYVDGEPEYACPDDNTPTRTPPTPRRGFGKLWCTQPGVRERLGNARRDEQGNPRTLQEFQRGVMLWIPERDRIFYVLNTETRRWIDL